MPRLIKSGGLLFLSVLLLGVGAWMAGGGNVLADLRRFPAWAVAAVFVAFALNLAVVTLRLSRLLQYFQINVPYSIAFKASLQGHFASLFFISLFGQVAGRQAILRNFGTPPVFIASLTAIERAVLFLVSGVFCLFGAGWLLNREEVVGFMGKISLSQIVIVVIVSLISSLWFGKSKFEAKLLTGIRSRKSIAQFFKITIITIFAQALVLGAFVFGAMGLAPEISFASLLAAAAITSFAASLPISVNGWGVREVTAIFAFGHVGMDPSGALAISILVGLCSTAVVLVAWPYVFRKEQEIIGGIPPFDQKVDRLPIEQTAAWGLVTASAIFIFFQIHIPLHGGVINLNLADPFAVLALAAVATHSFYNRNLPRWTVPKFNLLLLLFSSLLVLAFLNGVKVIGVTQWALTGRLFGWLVLLGYLSVGVLTVSYLGRVGVARFVETLVATAVVVILFHAVLRLFVFSGWFNYSELSLNFEGFSGNRNAFAFQLLVCSILLLAYASSRSIVGSLVFFRNIKVRREIFLAIIHGIILAGLMLTGSRAGILTGIILLVVFLIVGLVERRMFVRSVFYGFCTWLLFAWGLPVLIEIFLNDQVMVQSQFSGEGSDQHRWQTIVRGFYMWQENPLIGAGLGVFIETSSSWSALPIVIHSTPVWVLAELGLLGAGLMLAILFWIASSVTKAGLDKTANRAVIMLLGVFLIFGLVHEVFYQRIFWLVLGVCIALPFDERYRQMLARNSKLR